VAWFSLCDEINILNSQYWSAENPGLIHKLPLYEEKNWCLVCYECTPLDFNHIHGSTPEGKQQRFPQVH
jgi:hypothetical protein